MYEPNRGKTFSEFKVRSLQAKHTWCIGGTAAAAAANTYYLIANSEMKFANLQANLKLDRTGVRAGVFFIPKWLEYLSIIRVHS